MKSFAGAIRQTACVRSAAPRTGASVPKRVAAARARSACRLHRRGAASSGFT